MKPPKFQIGQRVVSIGNQIIDKTLAGSSFRPGLTPVYTVNWVGVCPGRNYWSIGCEEWPQEIVFEENGFAPVEELPAEALAELLEETLSPVTV